MATTIVWLAPSSSSSTLAQSHQRGSARTRTPPCPHTWTRSFAHGWNETNGLVRLAPRLRSLRDPESTTRRPSPASKFGNSNGTLVPEGVASEGTQGTGSWEKSAIRFVSCEPVVALPGLFYQEIFPWQAYSNQDGYLVPSNPPPPTPAPSEPPESRTTAASLSKHIALWHSPFGPLQTFCGIDSSGLGGRG